MRISTVAAILATLLSSANSFQNDSAPCGSGEFLCDNRKCIQDWYVCDGDNDCEDYTDESPPFCNTSLLTHGDSRAVIPPHQPSCLDEQFRCSTLSTAPTCIPVDEVCDGTRNCPAGDDEDFELCEDSDEDFDEDSDEDSDEEFDEDSVPPTSKTTRPAVPSTGKPRKIPLARVLSKTFYMIEGKESVLWDEAMEACSHADLTTAVISNKAEDDALTAALRERAHRDKEHYMWLGAILEDGKWIWAASKKELTFTNWNSHAELNNSATSPTNGYNCAYKSGSEWGTWACSIELGLAVCQRKLALL